MKSSENDKPRPAFDPVLRPRFVIGVFLSALFALLLIEGTVRLLKLGAPVYVPTRIEPGGKIPWVFVKENMPCYRPGSVFYSVYDPAGDKRHYFDSTGKVAYEINQNGFRGPERPIARGPNTFRVLCLGDSFTFGEGVRYSDTYVAQLERLIAPCFPGRSVEVINAGAQAYSTVQEGVLYFMRGQQLQPNVLILGFVLNDAMSMQQTVEGGDAQSRSHQVSALARLSRTWEIVERYRATAAQQQKFFTDIRLSFESEAWDHCKVVLANIAQSARMDKCRFIVVIFPVFFGLDGDYPFTDLHKKVAEACAEVGAESLDLLDVFRGRRAEDFWVHPLDQHPNEIAHRIIAEQIAARICPNK